MIDALAADAPFAGVFPGFAGRLRWTEGDGGEAEAPASLKPHLLCFHASSGGPWRAACSLWGQHYFNTLLIPAACLLASGWSAAGARRLSASFCAKSGAPLHFTLHGERGGGPSSGLPLMQLLDTHVRLTIDELAAEGGLSKRMLWESVDLTLQWTVAELAAHQPGSIRRLERLARRAQPGLRLASPCVAIRPPATSARKFCCLRYQLTGHGVCPEICPRKNSSPPEC